MGEITRRVQNLIELSDEISDLNHRILETAKAGEPVDPADRKKLSRLAAELERLPRSDTASDAQGFTRVGADDDQATSDES